MASLSNYQFLSFPRWNLKTPFTGAMQFTLVRDHQLRSGWVSAARSKKAIVFSSADEDATEPKVTKRTTIKRTASRSRNKATTEFEDDNSEPPVSESMSELEGADKETSIEGFEKPKRRIGGKALCTTSEMDEVKTEKKPRRGRPKKTIVASSADEDTTEPMVTKRTRIKQAASRGRKKATTKFEDDNSEPLVSESMSELEGADQEASIEGSVKPRRKAVSTTSEMDEVRAEKKLRRGRPKKAVVASSADEDTTEPIVSERTRIKRTTSCSRKKATTEFEDDPSEPLASESISAQEGADQEASIEGFEKLKRRTRGKAVSTTTEMDEVKTEKKPRRGMKSKKEVDPVDDQESETEMGDIEGVVYLAGEASEDEVIDLELEKGKDDDISFTYGWPPLVCCFGAAQHAFVPAGRPANRLVDYEIHESLKDALWSPEKFVRAPGGSAGSVAIALAALGGRVAFMGKLGDDVYGQAMLYDLNVNNVQTRSVCVDDERPTTVSKMEITKKGALRATTVKPCAEDSLLKSEINIDVLKEAKMFYLNTTSLLGDNMRGTTLHALKISKKLGGVIFYDLNLPLPLWRSCEETKAFVQQVWNLADVIEVTKQELEFLCGITPEKEFDTKNNKRSKFVHYEPDVITPIWRENLKVLFVTNGTSKIHYYTKEHDAAVLGMEDPPITPFTQDMSASGDGIVAGLMRMLTVQPHLITDKSYLQRTVNYAINCGVIDQWIVGRQRGFPPKEGMEAEPDINGIRSIGEREFRTVAPVTS